MARRSIKERNFLVEGVVGAKEMPTNVRTDEGVLRWIRGAFAVKFLGRYMAASGGRPSSKLHGKLPENSF